jgi:cell division protein FtsB
MSENSAPVKKRSGLVWILVLLLVGAGALIWFLVQSQAEAEALTAEKQQLTADLQDLMMQYDNLELANDSLMDVADEERRQMMATIDSITRLSKVDRKEIERLKSRVYRLQIEKKQMITQLDSMSTHIQKLEKEKELAELSLESEKEKTSELSRQRTKLEQTVAKGSLLTATSVEAHAIKRWNSGKESDTKRARRADEVKICFTIGKNTIANKGERDIYVRVMTPENTVVSMTDSSGNNTFNANGTDMLFSKKKVVWYEGKVLSECMYVTREDFTKGTYTVEIFTEDYMIGSDSFDLR